MKTLNAAIIEDQPANIEILRDLLSRYCPAVEVIAQSGSIVESVELLTRQQPDILFVDVELSDGDSFEIFDRLPELRSHLIFVTAHNHYALRAIKSSALDYLLKPIVVSELKEAVAKASRRLGQNAPVLPSAAPSHSLLQEGILALPLLNGFEIVRIADVMRIEADRSYSVLHMLNGDQHLVSRPIAEYDRLLQSQGFFRVHKTHLVNLRHIRRYVRGRGGQVFMADGSAVNVAARKRDAFLEMFGQV